MALPTIAGLFSALKAIPAVGGAGTSLIGGAVKGMASGTVPLAKGLTKINTALSPVSDAFNKTAGQASQLYGTFNKLKSGFEPLAGAAGGVAKSALALANPLTAVGKGIDLLKKPLDVVEAGFKKVAAQVAKIGTTAADVATKPLQLLTTGITAFNAPALKAIDTLSQFQGAVTAVGSAASQFTRLANPALTQRFQFASDDLTASIGRGLLPVLNLATKVTRGFADVVFTLAGPFARLQSAVLKPLGDIFDSVVSAASPAVRMVGPFVDLLGAVLRPIGAITSALFKIVSFGAESTFANIENAMKPMVVGLTVVADLIGDAARAFDGLVTRALGKLRSFTGMPAPVSGASAGAAVRNVGFSSAESYHNKLITTAFSLGTASPEERTASEVTEIKRWLVSELPKEMVRAIAGVPAGIAGEFVKFVNEVADRLAEHMPGRETAQQIGSSAVEASRWLEEQKGRLRAEAAKLGLF